MKQSELFFEFLKLNSYLGETKFKYLRDVKLSDLIILRITEPNYKIIYMIGGSSIIIPIDWINLFSSYNTEYGQQALSIGFEDTDELSKNIYNFLYLIHCFNNSMYQEFLKTLSILKSKPLIEWLRSNFNISIDPIEFKSKDKTITV